VVDDGNTRPDPLERAIALALVWPFALVGRATQLGRSGCSLARAGVRRFRDEVEAQLADGRPEPVTPVDLPDGGPLPDEPTVPSASAEARSLALDDYDHLPASQIVAMLADLDDDERAAIGDYERAHRHRRTILGKLDQLRDR
jgi:hypothetical protein